MYRHGDLPKSLRDPKLDVSFSGKAKEDVDQFLRQFRQQTEYVEPAFRGAVLLTCLSGLAANSFRSHFGSEAAHADFDEGVTFLRERFRRATFTHDRFVKIARAKQSGSAMSYFGYVEEQLALLDVDSDCG